MKTILAIIIARGGSKGLPNKNILPLNGMPLIEHTIKWIHKFKKKHKEIEMDIVVSTDMIEIENICDKYNGVDYYERSRHLAQDNTRAEEVLYDVCINSQKKYDYIIMLPANNPVRYNSILKDSINILKNEKETDCVISFQNIEKYNPAWMTPVTKKHLPDYWMEQSYRRQKLQQYMIHDGHSITFRYSYFAKFIEKNGWDYVGKMYEFYGSKIKPILHDNIIIDIDTQSDLNYAEYYMSEQI